MEVKDQGIGISENDIKKLFKPFTVIENSKKYNPNGVGLGLYLCKQFAERLGGDLWVESKLGMGSTFGFKIRVKFLANTERRLRTERN